MFARASQPYITDMECPVSGERLYMTGGMTISASLKVHTDEQIRVSEGFVTIVRDLATNL